MSNISTAFCLTLASAALVRAEAFSYECNSFPGDSDWIVINEFCDFEQWIDQGRLFQHVELCPGFPPPGGQQTYYTRDLNEYIV